MEAKKQKMAIQIQALSLIMLLMASPIMGWGCPRTNRRWCKDCIVNQMKKSCPTCYPVLHCMARCLWDGGFKTNCINKCNCYSCYPTLYDCKRCMTKCKCSCTN
ncbi:hypothetical protein MtrunA17_Chr2g0289811 [Medicago truncatula]|uniref:TNFR/CD27/30/40/95 cysteine-rich region n=1 Tax=Medicago truncatula TaxID=3880 RepID=Q2HT38_MEDTR|nr:TNFR/CD27/30/40/95 cysteine-rich region [Medicago truncatula]AES64468.1 transmembrane protein, putative [Medicago truncatula]RHN72624.1 hypothetical protein MtrunA17_Chr2g0289811 [Medicago truncatula]